jgi:hypothetical protein
MGGKTGLCSTPAEVSIMALAWSGSVGCKLDGETLRSNCSLTLASNKSLGVEGSPAYRVCRRASASFVGPRRRSKPGIIDISKPMEFVAALSQMKLR